MHSKQAIFFGSGTEQPRLIPVTAHLIADTTALTEFDLAVDEYVDVPTTERFAVVDMEAGRSRVAGSSGRYKWVIVGPARIVCTHCSVWVSQRQSF